MRAWARSSSALVVPAAHCGAPRTCQPSARPTASRTATSQLALSPWATRPRQQGKPRAARGSAGRTRPWSTADAGNCSSAEPDGGQHAHNVATDHLLNIPVRIVVGDEPANDVWERLRGVLDSVDVLDLLELETATRRCNRELLGEDVVHTNVIAEEDIGAERDVVDSDELGAVDEVFHDRFERGPPLRIRDRRVGRRRDADNAAPLRARAQDSVRLHALGIPQRAGARVGDEHWPVACGNDVEARLVARMR